MTEELQESIDRLGLSAVLDGLILTIRSAIQKEDVSLLMDNIRETYQTMDFLLEETKLTIHTAKFNWWQRWRTTRCIKVLKKILNKMELAYKPEQTFEEFSQAFRNS